MSADLASSLTTDDLIAAIRDVAVRSDFAGLTARADVEAEFPWPIWDAMADLGVNALEFPPDDGGFGASHATVCAVMSELGYHSIAASTALLTFAGFGTHLYCATPNGHPVRELLRGISNGSVRTALSLTEPSGGTDLAAMRTRLHPNANGFRLTGAKLYTTLARECTHLVVGALRPGQGDWPDRLALAVIAPDTPGVSINRVPTQALRTCPTFEIGYDDVPVPTGHVLDAPLAIGALRAMLNSERLAVASQSYGMGLRALRIARDQAGQREIGGGVLIDKQVVRHALVDAWQQLSASKALIVHAATDVDEALAAGAAYAADGVLPTMAQRSAAASAHLAADLAVQLSGGMGLTMDSPAQRLWRDTRLHLIGPIAKEASADYLSRSLMRAQLLP